jgi:prepilin-type N-terminal cleavage/methylation domain-containing protein
MRTGNTRAFTLVEVLIGILILGIGLLGLSAIFPAVVAQQRGASDAVEGTAAAQSAEAYLTSHVNLSQRHLPPHTNTNVYNGWEALAFNAQWSPTGAWQTAYNDQGPIALDLATGDLTIVGQTDVIIPVRDRLLPRPTFTNTDTGFGSARFVWDVAARRMIRRAAVSGTARTWEARLDDSIEVAVFLRRIDAGMRVRQGTNFVPVAENENGVPTYDGRGDNAAAGTSDPNYSIIRSTALAPFVQPGGTINPQRSVSFVFVSEEGTLGGGLNINDVEAAMGQVGQRFVTPKGDVVRVVRVEWLENVGSTTGTTKRPVLRIEPSVPYGDFDTTGGTGYETLNVLYTPQVPVGVKVFRVRDGGKL